MKTPDTQNKVADKTADAQQVKPEEQKKPAQPQKAVPETRPVNDDEEDENPFGGLSHRNLKKNLGCGG